MKIFLGVTGASGCVIALRLAEVLSSLGHEIYVVVSENALVVADYECRNRSWFLEKMKSFSKAIYHEKNLHVDIASSSNTLDAYIIAPASIKTLAMIVNGIGENLITRTALVGIRMKKTTLAIVRESPLGVVELTVLLKAAKLGIHIIPAVIGFYSYPQSIKDVIDFVVGKALDALGIQHNLYRRWKGFRDPQFQDPCEYLYGSANS
ncbi:UbiX family flavin prenyltransferase [Ignisphaera sp. 4213-co]|uniref:UbiX family flavin prenyltransferase n=1 Tax=Ignisphaera cupida TaxID=3050454 RepID=A0ABD4Z650_9CREN|nr:UbiX family flavin prenyltransferase [Ignisphaera sp. 4213-co]MDK6028442.1 UbiX family flavin prenyltransferase [Ignisphaera sp. 4213-co]